MLIKGVTVVRTAKGSGHVLVTTADQVFTIFSLWLHFDRCIMLFCWLCGWIKADHLQPDSLLYPFPLRQGEILWPVRRSSGAISSNVALTMCTSRKKWNWIFIVHPKPKMLPTLYHLPPFISS